MYSFQLSADISAPPRRVWQALCDPAEVARWDSGVSEAIDAPPDYPRPGQKVRWRYRSRWFRLLHDSPQAVEAEKRLQSILVLGPYYMDETYSLTASDTGSRLMLALDLTVRLPLIGGLVERLYAGRSLRAGFAASLAGLKRHCEGEAGA